MKPPFEGLPPSEHNLRAQQRLMEQAQGMQNANAPRITPDMMKSIALGAYSAEQSRQMKQGLTTMGSVLCIMQLRRVENGLVLSITSSEATVGRDYIMKDLDELQAFVAAFIASEKLKETK